MPRDILAETAILKILNRLSPTPLTDSTLASELDIAVDRQLTRAEFQELLQSLNDRKFIKRSDNRMGLPICWITETGRAVLN